MAGQAFEMVITRDATGWVVSVPELGAVTRDPSRADAEATARDLISHLTGIPHAFVALWSRD
ncbi:long chain fatty acid-CoA synthetase Faa4p [Mycobacterium sp. PS03-16]|uniref:long chain fatty acid-CoA synthetase Faa4p n=1 Tax=Mycobacterium sp. PS03-16 TaxID=2559611 RepID=UPI001073E4CD|nr:long chain fatty acid-CoA synthetase Faa4p [Mycobacterium sp. PS03-16]TFV59420.1 long chain fatty acid-CoA synthetase Faa4p [Mycobacterium sp. PS03-16]